MSRSRTAPRRVLRIATASLAALVLTLSGSAAAYAAETPTPTTSPTTASISGTVSAEADGAPISGASVVVLDASGTEAAAATTASDGTYAASDLAAGDYTVSVEAASFSPRFWPTADTAAQAEKVTVSAGESRAGVDVKLAAVAAAAPVVAPAVETPAPSDPSSDAPSDPSAAPTASSTSDPAAEAPSDPPAAPTDPASAQSTLPSAEQPSVTPSAAPAEQMATAPTEQRRTVPRASTFSAPSAPTSATTGSISGKVTRASDGAPVSGVSITASVPNSGTNYGFATTVADGTYTVIGLASSADYRIVFQPGDQTLSNQYWKNTEDYQAALPISVGDGQAVSGIDAALVATGTISGRVVDAETGAPLSGIWVFASNGMQSGQGHTDQNGQYSLWAAPGQYLVEFQDNYSGVRYATQYWNNVDNYAAATAVIVSSDKVVSGIDAHLLRPALITGHLMGLTGVDGGQVVAFRQDGTVASSAHVVTGTDGSYALAVPSAGTYILRAQDDSGHFAPQFYQQADSVDAATPITVAQAQTVSGIDFNLSTLAATASGNVSASGSLDPTSPWATIAAYQWGADSAWHEAARITGWGSYAFGNNMRVSGWGSSVLTPGTYTVGFSATGFCSQYFDAKASLDSADRFTLAAGDSKTGVNAVLSKDCVQPSVTAGAPTISGMAQVGQTLTVDPGDWQPAPVGLTYQWLADGTAIPNAAGTTLTLTDAQLGKQITVTVTGSRPGYTTATATSPTAGPVTAAPPKTMTPGTPTITGSTVAGSTLTAHPGTWTPADATFSYQWLADGTPIAAATGTTFVPGGTEVGKKITVTVTGTKAGYADGSATSAAVGPITAAPLKSMTPGTPTIGGTAKVGETLTAAPGTWAPATAAFTYQWNAEGAPIAGATGATLVLDPVTAGKTVTVTVRGTADGYDPASATSAAAGPVANGTLTSAVPTVSGTAQVGQTLTANPGNWGPQPVALTYQWVVDGVPVDGATGATFTPVPEQVGKPLSVTVTGTRDGYDPTTKTVSAGIIAPAVALSTGQAGPGATITVTGSSFGANEEVALELHSTVYPLGTVKTDANGSFTAQVTLPAGVTGEHHIVATGKTSGRVGQAAITIVAPGGAGGDSGSGADSGSSGSGTAGGLAITGSEIPLIALVLAIVLVAGGGVLAWRRRESR